MAYVKSHPRFLALLLCLAAGAVTLGWWSLAPTTAVSAVGPSALPAAHRAALMQVYEPLEESVADRIARLRRETGTDDAVLAAANLDAQGLVTVLSTLRTWFESNAATLATRDAAISSQRALIVRLESANTNGQNVIEDLNTARSTLADLEESHRTYLASARATWLSVLSQQQLALADLMWDSSLDMPYRVLDLNDGQQKALRSARVRYQQRLSVTRDSASRHALKQQFEQDLETAIGSGNLTQLGSLAEYLAAASQRVVAAVNLVLPREGEG